MATIDFFRQLRRYGEPLGLVNCGSASGHAAAATAPSARPRSRFAHSYCYEALSGPLADSGADCSFVGAQHGSLFIDHAAATPRSVKTGNGLVVVDAVATVDGAAGLLRGKYVLPGCWESLVSVGELCEIAGCGYAQDPGNVAARFWHDYPGHDVELVREGRLFRVPLDAPEAPWTLALAASGGGAGCAALTACGIAATLPGAGLCGGGSSGGALVVCDVTPSPSICTAAAVAGNAGHACAITRSCSVAVPANSLGEDGNLVVPAADVLSEVAPRDTYGSARGAAKLGTGRSTTPVLPVHPSGASLPVCRGAAAADVPLLWVWCAGWYRAAAVGCWG